MSYPSLTIQYRSPTICQPQHSAERGDKDRCDEKQPRLVDGHCALLSSQRAEYLISQRERVISTDHSSVANGIEPDNRDSLKFLLLNETMNIRREPLAADGLYAI